MKIIYQYFVFFIVLIFLCSCNKSESTKLYDVPAGYGNDYEIAEFERFNSYASENGLGGTKILLEGKLEDLFLDDLGLADKTKIIGAYLVSGKDEKWVVLLDHTPYREMSDYEDLEGHIVTLRGHYSGYSDLFSMPVIYVDSGYDRNTGDFFTSASYDDYYASEDDSETSDSYKTKKSSTSDFDSKTNVTVEHYGISFEIPKNWANLEVIGEGIYYNNRKFLLGYTENETDLERTKNGVIEGLKEVENIKNFKVNSSEKYHFKTFKKEYYKIIGSGTIANKDVNMVYIVFEANNGMITMGVFDEQEDEYDYSEDFDKIIDTIIINDDKDSSFSGTKSDNPRDNSIAFGTSLDDSNSSVFTLHDMTFRVPNDFEINSNSTSEDYYEFYNNSYGSTQIVKLFLKYSDVSDEEGLSNITQDNFTLVEDSFADGIINKFDNVKRISNQYIKIDANRGYLYRFDGEAGNYPL